MSATSSKGVCICAGVDRYRIKRRGCPVHAETDAAYWAERPEDVAVSPRAVRPRRDREERKP